MDWTASELLAGLRTMATIREFEERLERLFYQGKIRGSVHLAMGQEAVAVGACHALAPGDVVAPTYRGHAWALAKGHRCQRCLRRGHGQTERLQSGARRQQASGRSVEGSAAGQRHCRCDSAACRRYRIRVLARRRPHGRAGVLRGWRRKSGIGPRSHEPGGLVQAPGDHGVRKQPLQRDDPARALGDGRTDLGARRRIPNTSHRSGRHGSRSDVGRSWRGCGPSSLRRWPHLHRGDDLPVLWAHARGHADLSHRRGRRPNGARAIRWS